MGQQCKADKGCIGSTELVVCACVLRFSLVPLIIAFQGHIRYSWLDHKEVQTMSKQITYVCFEIPSSEHRKLRLLSIEKGCSLKSLLQEAVQAFIQAKIETETENKETC